MAETEYIRAMPKKNPPSPDEKPQHERFKEAARELEADKNAGAFEDAFGKAVPPARPKAAASKKND